MLKTDEAATAPLDGEDPYGIRAGASSGLDGARVLKHGETFAVLDKSGDVPSRAAATYGLFHLGTRFLSRFGLRLAGARPMLLSSAVSDDNILHIDLTNPDLTRDGQLEIAHGTVHVQRTMLLWNGVCHERLAVTNFCMRPCEIEIAIDYAADFVDLFEVRGILRLRRGRVESPKVDPGGVVLAYLGLDDVRRTTRIDFSPRPTEIGPQVATFRLRLEPKETKRFDVTIACIAGDPAARPHIDFDHAQRDAVAALARCRRRRCAVTSSNGRFDEWIERAQSDLSLMVTETPHGPYPYAGIPWFSTPFGRDAVITALLTLWTDPELARGVLRFLAAHQADAVDESRDAEPGKIVHELRPGEMAALREIPFGRYYGGVDTTPLFAILLGEYVRTTGDLGLVDELWPSFARALDWIERWGDRDFDGFVEYGCRPGAGLVHQGWKDSHDSVFHADGSDAEGPIALCEVQGYVYAAWRAAADLSLARGDRAAHARFTASADELRARFDAAFWCDEIGCYALALDGRKERCCVRTSNAGQCLFTGIALPQRVPALAEMLMSDDMFSGWGVRTLSSRERRYNPLSYHNGSVWPHDNALVALGLARYGYAQHAVRILEGLFDASQFFDLHRMPELFCGLPRTPGEGPTQYPVACSPQAWAAAAPFGLLDAVLGLDIRAEPPRLRFENAILPRFLDDIVMRGMTVGQHRVCVRLHRYPEDVGVNVSERTGPVEIVVVK
jgi:glycogen debranching enzyme